MKRLAFVIMLLLALESAAKHDGWYNYTLTRNYVTPHLDWGMGNAPPLRVLLMLQPRGARDAVEIAERMNLEYTEFITHSHDRFFGSDVYTSALTGSSRKEKEDEIRRKAHGDYDVMVLGNAPFEKFPPDVQYEILQKVRDGCGLVINCVNLPYGRLFANPVKDLPFLKHAPLPPGLSRSSLRGYNFGKGRILVFRGPVNGPALTPDIPLDNH